MIANIKAKDIGGGTVAFACTAPTTAAGKLHDPAAEEEPRSSGKVYTGLFVRHWDAYVGPHKNAVWYGALGKKEGEGGGYELRAPGLVNALAGTRLECPVPNFGGAGDYDIGPAGLVFLSKDPDLNPALWTKTDLYYVALRTFTEAEPPAPRAIPTAALQGYSGNPVFSHGGKQVVFKRMRDRQYEADKWRLLLVSDITAADWDVREFYETPDGNGDGGWDLSPASVVWSPDDRELYVTAEKEGRVVVFSLPSDPREAAARGLPRQLTRHGSVADLFTLGSGSGDDGPKLLLSSSSLVESSAYAVLEPRSSSSSSDGGDDLPAEPAVVSSSAKGGRSFGLSRDQVDEFWFEGAGRDYKCHALVMKPSSFDPEKKYPLAFLIHGGPQGAWGESW